MSSSESESDDIAEVVGYQFEPEFTEEEIVCQNDASSPAADFNERGISLDWCVCENCTILPTFKECLCCHEFEHYMSDYISVDTKCISLHPDFDTVCLSPVILETAYIIYLRHKSQRGRAPEHLNNK
jgi:hypothetical protein